MHIYTHIYIYIYVYIIYIYIYIYICIHIYNIHVYIYVYEYIKITSMYIYTCMKRFSNKMCVLDVLAVRVLIERKTENLIFFVFRKKIKGLWRILGKIFPLRR